jgi:hypothetical protein
VQLLIRQRASIAGLALPNQGCLVAPPCRQVTIETVIRDVDLATGKPLSVRRRPLQNSVPLLEPVKLALSKTRPEGFQVRRGFRAQRLQLRHRFDVRLGGKFRPRIKDTFFVEN